MLFKNQERWVSAEHGSEAQQKPPKYSTVQKISFLYNNYTAWNNMYIVQ